jgi:hypothetical protein
MPHLEVAFYAPTWYLPPSFHETVFQAAWKTADVYHDPTVRNADAARQRFFDTVCVVF